MDEETFWAIVDEARADAYEDDEAFLRELESSLMELPPNAIESFRDRLDDMARKAFRWDLWGAAYIINGSASEDAFENFRGWLVSRGRSIYEAAPATPKPSPTSFPWTRNGLPSSKNSCIYPYIRSSKRRGRRCRFPIRSRRPKLSSSPKANPGTRRPSTPCSPS